MKKIERMYGVAQYDDGMMQIIIMDKNQNIVDETQEFPRHELYNMLAIFFDMEIEMRNEITQKFELINGGK